MEEKKTKVCTCCGRELPLEEFYNNCTRKDGHSSICKKCTLEKNKEVYKKAKETLATKQPGIKATFKISDFKDEMLFAELRRRGYKGELKYVKEVVI